MATHTQVTLVDDLDGSAAALTMAFALEGRSWEIDLNEEHAEQLRQALEPFIAQARRTRGIVSDGPRRRRALSRPAEPAGANGDSKADAQEKRSAIRAWAHENGIQVSERGRISEAIVRTYEEAQGAVSAPAKKAPAKKAAARAKDKEMANA